MKSLSVCFEQFLFIWLMRGCNRNENIKFSRQTNLHYHRSSPNLTHRTVTLFLAVHARTHKQPNEGVVIPLRRLLLSCNLINNSNSLPLALQQPLGLGRRCRNWLCLGPASFYQSIRWFNVKRKLLSGWSWEVGSHSTWLICLHVTRQESNYPSSRKRWIFDNHGRSDLDPYPRVKTFIIFSMMIQSNASHLEWEAC